MWLQNICLTCLKFFSFISFKLLGGIGIFCNICNNILIYIDSIALLIWLLIKIVISFIIFIFLALIIIIFFVVFAVIIIAFLIYIIIFIIIIININFLTFRLIFLLNFIIVYICFLLIASHRWLTRNIWTFFLHLLNLCLAACF